MPTLLGNLDSGNVHKVQMLLARRGIDFVRVDVRQDRDEPRDPRFLALNPMGKVPVLIGDDGDVLTDSGAIVFWLAQGTLLWPNAARDQAEVLRWMFFEQYSHEPALAVMRYLVRFTPDPAGQTARVAELAPRAHFALDVLAQALRGRDWIAGAAPTIADYALYPYTALSDEIGIATASRPAVAAWLARMTTLPAFLPVYADAAREVIPFARYFADGPGALNSP